MAMGYYMVIAVGGYSLAKWCSAVDESGLLAMRKLVDVATFVVWAEQLLVPLPVYYYSLVL